MSAVIERDLPTRSGNTTPPLARWRAVTAVTLLLLSEAGAAAGMVSQLGVARAAGPATQQTEVWHAFGLAFFAVLFCLLARWPRRLPGIWELTILCKGLLSAAEFAVGARGARDGVTSGMADLALVALLTAAYLLSRGHRAWR